MIVIKEKELQEFRPQIRYQDGQDITLQAIQSLLQGEAQQAGIPIAFRLDQVRGGLFGGAEDCLVLYHPEHQKTIFQWLSALNVKGIMHSSLPRVLVPVSS